MDIPVHKFFVATFLFTFLCISSVINAAAISGQGTWETTLLGRDLDGNDATFEAYYDTVLDITWLADANYAQTSGYDADGMMDYRLASLGFSNWRLPRIK